MTNVTESNIMVIGLGTMGTQLSELMISKGFNVWIFHHDLKPSENGYNKIKKDLERLHDKGKITELELKNRLDRIIYQKEISEINISFDFVIEAIIEDEQAKKTLLQEIEKYIDKETIICSNTSSLSISRLQANLVNPSRLIGLHFFNPPHIMKLVEIVKGEKTSDTTISRASHFASSIDKSPVIISDSPGFIVNRLLITMINQAIAMYRLNVASVEDIDTAMVFGANHPIGPLALADLIGLDVCLNILNVLYKELSDVIYKPDPLLKQMCKNKKYGRKSKVGFYTYEK